MNLWTASSVVLLAGLFICGVMCMRRNLMNRMAAFQLSNVLAVIIMLSLAEGFHDDIYFDTVLCLAVISFAGTITFLRFLEKWL